MVTEDVPFDEDVLVFRVGGRIFALVSMSAADALTLKADPELSLQWRSEFPQIRPGYHMNKTHWNTVSLEGLSLDFLRQMIAHSYQMVWQKLPLKLRTQTS
ncbi:MAG: hypothetical protein RL160_610 [Bacteroidota bacterium]|jgi:predicted DNA-binding protein (MmcQ/YjbR family)